MLRAAALVLLCVAGAIRAQEQEVPRTYTSIVITGKPVEPEVDQKGPEIFNRTLFSRDDQIFHVLDAGINAGQHEGGGKSVEIRRFGFNLDHGGVSGGLKVLVDDVQQNQETQGHGQGYLGSLKSITPELVEEVNIINGPFSAEYGDFSGLGVVHIRLRESLPDVITARIQGGFFGSLRTFLGISPEVKNGDMFLAYEGSQTDGPFIEALRYRRDNYTGNYTRRLNNHKAIGLRFNTGRNNFYSSGQIPLDEVSAGRLDRFGFIDPADGGHVNAGTLGMYYRLDNDAGATLKADGFLTRSLFDLYSNFTFFLKDPGNGDGIQQHDSRLTEGANVQYQRPWTAAGVQTLFSAGANYRDNQINVGLYGRVGRTPIGVTTRAHAHVTNGAGYVQESASVLHGALQLGAGLRYDEFRFDVADQTIPSRAGVQAAGNWQPKASLAYTPTVKIPLTFHVNYGRGISTSDARAVVQNPGMTRAATTDFLQVGTSHRIGRVSASTDAFLIDRSNEMVYIPDDGSFEFKGPSRAYGLEVKTSVELTRHLWLSAGVTKVANAFYRGTAPRVYVDSAPHFTANAGLAVAAWHGWSGSLRLRAINHYRLDGQNASIVASGNTVADLSVSRRIAGGVEFNLTVDNATNRDYWETQNYFESRLPGQQAISRIHGTPGYPLTAMAGLTFRIKGK